MKKATNLKGIEGGKGKSKATAKPKVAPKAAKVAKKTAKVATEPVEVSDEEKALRRKMASNWPCSRCQFPKTHVIKSGVSDHADHPLGRWVTYECMNPEGKHNFQIARRWAIDPVNGGQEPKAPRVKAEKPVKASKAKVAKTAAAETSVSMIAQALAAGVDQERVDELIARLNDKVTAENRERAIVTSLRALIAKVHKPRKTSKKSA